MPVFLPLVPNWQNGVRDTYAFKTDVFTARDGSEQRRSLRDQPRRTVDAAILLDGERLRTFADALNNAKDGRVEVADFSADAAVLTTTVSDGATVLTVERVPRWLVDGLTCTLLTGRLARKVTVDFVSDLTVVLTAGLSGSVGAGAKLLPLIPAFLGTTNTLSVYTTMVATSAIALEIEPGTVVRNADPLPFDDEPDAETTQVFGPAGLFYGKYVLLRKPNYLQRPQFSFNLPFEKVDYDRGVVKTFAPVPIVSRTLTATYMATSHAEAMTILDIFIRAKGRAGEIYVPTWGNDLPPVKAIDDDEMRLEGEAFCDTYDGDLAHRAVLIRTKTGQLIPKEIHSMAKASGDTFVTFDSPIGVAASDIEIVSWLFSARFAQDSLTIDWRTDAKANITLSFVTLVNLASEQSFGPNWILATGYWRDLGAWDDNNVWQDS